MLDKKREYYLILKQFTEDFFKKENGFKVKYCPLLSKAIVVDKEGNKLLLSARDDLTVECYDGPDLNTLFQIDRITIDPQGNYAWEALYDRYNK